MNKLPLSSILSGLIWSVALACLLPLGLSAQNFFQTYPDTGPGVRFDIRETATGFEITGYDQFSFSTEIFRHVSTDEDGVQLEVEDPDFADGRPNLFLTNGNYIRSSVDETNNEVVFELLDPTGNVLNIVSFGYPVDDAAGVGQSAEFADGDVFISYFYGEPYAGTTPPPRTVAYAKIDPVSGTIAWQDDFQSVFNVAFAELRLVEIAPDGSVFAARNEEQPINQQHFVTKISPSGQILWDVQVSNLERYPTQLVATDDGSVWFIYNQVFEWIERLDANGTSSQIQPDPVFMADVIPTAIAPSPDNGVMVTGILPSGGPTVFTALFDADLNPVQNQVLDNLPFLAYPRRGIRRANGEYAFTGSFGDDASPFQHTETFLLTLNENGEFVNNPNGDIDLELGLSITPPDPNIYETTSLTLTLSNTGGSEATGIMVDFPKPAGTVYEGGNEWTASQGTFNPFGNEMWDVGSLPAGGTATLEVNYFMLTALPVTVYAQLSAANETDADSTPGNGISPAANEDDEAVGSINGSTNDPCAGNLTINNQTDLNNFPSTCTVWDGDLTITGTDITDLSPLSNLQQVTGDLQIGGVPNLTSITGLQNLTSTGGDLFFGNCPGLTSLALLSNVQSVGGRLQVSVCPALESLDGLQGVTSVFQLWISDNLNLSECCAVADLISNGGVQGTIVIFNNDQFCGDEDEILANCGGVNCSVNASVSNIQCDDNGTPNDPTDDTFGFILLANNPAPSTGYGIFLVETSEFFNGTYGSPIAFGNIPISTGNLTVNLTDDVTGGCSASLQVTPPAPCSSVQVICPGDTLTSQAEVDAWAGCSIVEGNLRIAGSDITDLSPLATLQTVRGAFSIDDNTVLTNLSGLENVDSVGVLIIAANDQLENLDALNLSQTEIVSIIINDNDNLLTVSGLDNFESPEFLSISSNDNLTSITGFNGLATMDGNLFIEFNTSLTNLGGFANLTTIDGAFQIVGNNVLPGISGFGNLSTITDNFIVSTNAGLVDLNGLNSLSDIFFFAIAGNGSLENLDVFSQVPSVSDGLFVGNNAALSDCCGLFNILSSGVPGSLTIENNQVGCNDPQDILDNCVATGVDLELSLAQPNGSPAQWSSYDVIATLTNAGGETVTGVKVSFPKPTGVVYTGGNEFDASQGTFNPFGNEDWNVGSLGAGESATLTVSYFLLQSNSPVAYAQVSAADQPDTDSTPGNGTPPTPNEDDEASTDSGGTPLPDLILVNLNLQNSPIEAGQVLSYTFDASNQGAGAASGNFNIKAWISTDSNISTDDIQDGIVPTGNYGPGLTVTDIAGASTIPANLANGQYFLILKVDADDQIAEGNEGNNVVSAMFTVTGDDPGTSCSFTTFYTPSGFDPLDTDREMDLLETASGYVISQNNDFTFIQNPPANFGTYELDLDGNVLDAFNSPFPVIYDVELEVDANENLSMVFNQSPDLPAGTVVPIDIGYPNPTAVIASGKAVKTSNGYAFGIGIIDASTSLINRVFQTDNVGQNVTFADLPDPEFFSGGFGRLVEGPDGSIAVAYQTSGNYSIFVVPADGSPAWQDQIAADTPSTNWEEIEISQDGNFVYMMKTDNLQTFVAKYEMSTGNLVGIDISDLKTSPVPNGFRQTFAQGIEPTPDGGLLVSLFANEFVGSGPDNFEVLAKYDAAGNLVWKLEIPEAGYGLTPVGETSDGGTLFAGNSGAAGETVILKTTAGGVLTPECGDTGDCSIAVTVSNVTCPPPTGNWQQIIFNYQVTGTNTPGDWLAQFAFGLNQGGDPDLVFTGGGFPASGTGSTFVPLGETSVVQSFFIPSFNCGDNVAISCPGNGDIDLSLDMSSTNPDPPIYTSTEINLTVTNAGPMTATGIVVDFPKPNGTVYTGGNEWSATQGSFNPFGNEHWDVGSLAAGESATLTVSYFLLTGNALTPYAQVIAANETDGDSTPGNGTCCSPNEDDEATLTLNAFAGGGSNALQIPELVGRPVQLKSVQPNPVYFGEMSLTILSKVEGHFDLECYDLFGRLAFLEKIELQVGRNDIPLDVTNLESGTYYLNMPGQNWRHMPVRFVVARW